MVVGTGVLTQIPHSSISTTITNPTQDGLPRSKVMEDGPSVQIMENIFQDATDAGEEVLHQILLLPISLPPMSLILNGLQSSKPTENGPSKPILENIWLVAMVVPVPLNLISLLFTSLIQQ